MSEELLVRHCAPTLAGLKTGNLINCPVGGGGGYRGRSCSAEPQVKPPRGCRCGCWPGRKTGRLSTSTGRGVSDGIWPAARRNCSAGRGYPAPDAERCLRCLAGRLGEGGFPHEIGLFLGYPLQDVLGFIENRGQGSKLVGTWKVYGDEEAARRTFARYKKCTAVYSRCLKEGTPLEKLAVRA